MLHHRLDPNKVKKSYAFAAVAKAENINFFYFTPEKVNFSNNTIIGQMYDNGEWYKKAFPFPDVIYNSGNPNSYKAQTILNHLRSFIPFTSHPVGSKMKVYRKVKNGQIFAQHLIPSKIIEDIETIDLVMLDYLQVIIKPVAGHQGIGVIFIEKAGENYHLIEKDTSFNLTRAEFINSINDRINKEDYLVQPYINSKTKDGNAYDYRLHVQKNGQGHWIITCIYPRIGPRDSIITDFTIGGSTLPIEHFLRLEFPLNHLEIYQQLVEFALGLARHLDEIYLMSFDELGFDVALDTEGKIWLYEVNWRPDLPPTFSLDLDVIKNTLQFAVYLAKHKQETTKNSV
jgi:hypothetical protein